jgi:hypothetical protein
LKLKETVQILWEDSNHFPTIFPMIDWVLVRCAIATTLVAKDPWPLMWLYKTWVLVLGPKRTTSSRRAVGVTVFVKGIAHLVPVINQTSTDSKNAHLFLLMHSIAR